jgi:hypothetical protein
LRDLDELPNAEELRRRYLPSAASAKPAAPNPGDAAPKEN